jgi:hypothetical protein
MKRITLFLLSIIAALGEKLNDLAFEYLRSTGLLLEIQRTDIESIAGAIIGISAQLPATFDAAGYDASAMLFTTVGKVESIGNHGMAATVTKFTPIDTATVNKIKGSKDYGTMSLSMGSVPGDAGQVLLKTASENGSIHYSIELRYPDGEFHYLDVLVTKFEYADGTVNDVQKVNVDLEICRKPVIIPQP